MKCWGRNLDNWQNDSELMYVLEHHRASMTEDELQEHPTVSEG